MSDKTKIEWADATWNPVTGCSKISIGCEHCYAERMVKRFPKIYPNGFKPTLHENRLEEPLKWKKPRRIFVCSMGDLFHENVHIEWVYKVFDVMKRCPQHTFLLLTKRPGRAKALTETMLHFYFPEEADALKTHFSHVWFGVTIESRENLARAEVALQTGFAHKFVSLEPLLSSMPIGKYLFPLAYRANFEWVIVGGETGPGARLMKYDWARYVLDACRRYKIPFFFKKWGGKINLEYERILDGQEWNEFPKEMKGGSDGL